MQEPIAQPTQPKKSRPFWKKAILFLLITAALAVLVLVIVATFFEQQVTEKILANLNKSLKTKLEVRAHQLSLLKKFPEATLDLQGVRLGGAGGGNLLEAEHLNFNFNLTSLFSDKILVKSIEISDGALVLKTDSRGRSNYEISKETPQTKGKNQPAEPEKDLEIALQNCEFKNLELIYENEQTRQAALVEVQKAEFSGNFSAKKYNMASRADCTIGFFETDSTRYLVGEAVNYSATFAVDMSQNLFNFQAVEASIGGNVFAVSGIAIDKPDYTDFNLRMDSKEGDISMVFNLLPERFHEYFKDFESEGTYACGGTVKGRLSANQHPTVSFGVRLRDGKVTSDKLQSPIRNVRFQANYTARPDGQGNFEIAGFEGDFGGSPLRFDLKINNLDDPTVNFKMNGTLPLAATWGLFDLPEISDGEGKIQVPELTVEGKYADMISMNRIPFVAARGKLVFENAELTYNSVPLEIPGGEVKLDGNILSAEKIRMRVGDSQMSFDVAARNLLPVLFADSLNSENAQLDFAGSLLSSKMDFAQIEKMFSVQATENQVGVQVLDSLKTAKTVERESILGKLNGTFNLQIADFTFEKITGKNFAGKFAFDRNVLLVAGDVEAMGGKIHVEGEHKFDLQPNLHLRATTQNVDLKTCFEQFDDFGQEFLTQKNLRGRLDAKVAVWAFWNEKGEFQLDKTRILADLSAKQGELTDLKMLEDFSSFVHLEDLRRVKFSQLQNFFELSNRRFIIPAMAIQSNAVNLTFSGTHTFDHAIDYKIKVNAGQVLFNKMKKHDSDLDPLPEKNGWLNLFYVVRGTVEDFKYHRSKKTVKSEFERSEEQRRGMASRLDFAFANAPKFPEIVSFLERD